MDEQKVGVFIAELRRAGNYTQAEFALMLNISPQAVSKWERGESMPDIGHLPVIARLLGITVDELLAGERKNAAPQSAGADGSMGKPVHGDVREAANQRNSDSGDIREAANQQNSDSEDIRGAANQRNSADARHLANRAEWHPLERQLEDDSAGGPVRLDKLVQLAPFVSASVLNDAVEQAVGEANWSIVQSLAPFLSQETLERLLDRMQEEQVPPAHIVSIAPFVGEAALDKLVGRLDTALDWSFIRSLAPFLSQQSLSRLCLEADGETLSMQHLIGLAPFLDFDDFPVLLENIKAGDIRADHLAALAPFLPQHLVDRLVRK